MAVISRPELGAVNVRIDSITTRPTRSVPRDQAERGRIAVTVRSDFTVYINCMTHVRDRLTFIRTNMRGNRITGNHFWDVEIIFLHFRRVLELIAFSSLAANLDAYATAQEKYREHYNAQRMLRDVELINPAFYPQPVEIA